MLFRVATPLQEATPVRFPTWNATLRAGDDLKIALTVLKEDGETPADVTHAFGSLDLMPDEPRGWWGSGPSYDYGFGWSTYRGLGAREALGTVWNGPAGRMNFMLPAAGTKDLCGRFRAFFQIDLPDGSSTMMEGVLSVQPGARNVLGNAPRYYVDVAGTPAGQGLTAPNIIGGLAYDADGFPLATAPYPVVVIPPPPSTSPSSSAVLGVGVLGFMVLGVDSSGYTPPSRSSVLGVGTLGNMILGFT